MLKQQENLEKESDIRGEQKEIGWGNQIRSYVMQPYTMVKDHRTNVESGEYFPDPVYDTGDYASPRAEQQYFLTLYRRSGTDLRREAGCTFDPKTGRVAADH